MNLGNLWYSKSLLFGIVLFPTVSLASGCASNGSLIDNARKAHSYTPCGMMMNAVMPHEGMHGESSAPAAPADSAATPEGDSTLESAPEPTEHVH